jgi:hypothetical protein
MDRSIEVLMDKSIEVLMDKLIEGMVSVEFATDLELHFHMRQVLPGDFSSEEDDHHVEGPIIAMEFACGFDQGPPVLRVLVDIVLAKFYVYLFELGVETHH